MGGDPRGRGGELVDLEGVCRLSVSLSFVCELSVSLLGISLSVCLQRLLFVGSVVEVRVNIVFVCPTSFSISSTLEY